MRRLVTLALVTAAAVATAAVGLAAPSPKAELAAMRSAARSEHSVHSVSANSSPGYKIRTVSDVGHGKGVQRMTVTHLGKTGRGEVRIISKNAYIKGNRFMMKFWGFEPAQGNQFAGQWIFIPHSSPAYVPFADGATFASFAGTLFPVKDLSLVQSGHLIGVHGTQFHQQETVNETILAPAQGKPLPTRETDTYQGHPGKDVSNLSLWNEAIHVAVPAKAVPIEVITGG